MNDYRPIAPTRLPRRPPQRRNRRRGIRYWPLAAAEVVIAIILTRLAGRSLGDGRLHDAAGRVVISYPAPTWDAYLSLAIDEILLFGSGSLQITRRLRALLDDLRAITPPPRRPAIDLKLAALRRAARRAFPDKADEAEAVRPDRQGIGSPRR